MQRKYIVITLVVLCAVVLLLFFFISLKLRSPSQVVTPEPKRTIEDDSLGGQIFEQSQNPIQEKLPDTNPVKNANPIEGAYTNPF
ncbi:MAG: hypothetical protein AAB340_01005 [Patescibacteria group bacterium]